MRTRYSLSLQKVFLNVYFYSFKSNQLREDSFIGFGDLFFKKVLSTLITADVHS